ncbi:HK97 gp10 family phage protein [Tumebacillus sp. DT12]|uniref:HK97 gp10 family phage protein n=1 Tax=Tumebacillus lacus TaxID=2995335 RepID=A0ABT3X6N1_9BACL|nr:HK97-gp10 family putative phage morphogenesis protein [Tumebacillus lacus]MCX7570409.1 HK97 gp10 family phage protein [Tumebacillus lacus]
MGAEMSLDGLADVLRKVDQLGDRKARAENRMLRAGAKVLQAAISEDAPRSSYAKDHMADNIMITNISTRDGIKRIRVGPSRGDNSRFFYGKFLEWGTLKMAARPFVGPAAARSKKDVFNAMKAEGEKEFRR